MTSLDYQRVNWEDAPSVATPLSAENLSNMDNGIASLYRDVEALETAVEDIEVSDVSETTATFDDPADAPLQASGSTIFNIITGIHSRIRALFDAISNDITVTDSGKILDARVGNALATMMASISGDYADRDYNIGDYLIVNSEKKLYEVIDTIHAGDELQVGVNIAENSTTVANELSALYAMQEGEVLTTTYTSQSYVTEAAFDGLTFYRIGKVVYCYFNLNVSSNPGTTSRKIGSINLPSAPLFTPSLTLANQGNQYNLLLQVTAEGDIYIYSNGSSTGWYRGFACIMLQ